MGPEHQQLNPQEQKVFDASLHGQANQVADTLRNDIKPQDWQATMQDLTQYSQEHYTGRGAFGLEFNTQQPAPGKVEAVVGAYPASGFFLDQVADLNNGTIQDKTVRSCDMNLSGLYSDTSDQSKQSNAVSEKVMMGQALDGQKMPTGDVLTNEKILSLPSGEKLTVGTGWTLRGLNDEPLTDSTQCSERQILDVGSNGIHVIADGAGTSTLYFPGGEQIKLQGNSSSDMNGIDATVSNQGKSFQFDVVNRKDVSKGF